MMPLYPTFEELKVDELLTAQNAVTSGSYTSLAEFLGLDLTNFHYNDHGELVPGPAPARAPAPAPTSGPTPVATPQPSTNTQQLAVPANSSRAVMPAVCGPGDIKPGLRRVTLCKNAAGKVGVQLISKDAGIFVSMVQKGLPAALGGLRFGDQVVSICDTQVGGMSGENAMKIIRKAPVNNIVFVVRDRPFERTLVVNKSSTGSIGITLDDGRITKIQKDSSASRNGVLINHQIVEVDGVNVMGMKDSELKELLHKDLEPVRLTILPIVIYKHLIKHLLDDQIRRQMDRSAPCA